MTIALPPCMRVGNELEIASPFQGVIRAFFLMNLTLIFYYACIIVSVHLFWYVWQNNLVYGNKKVFLKMKWVYLFTKIYFEDFHFFSLPIGKDKLRVCNVFIFSVKFPWLTVCQICEGIPVVSAWQSTGYAAEALYRWALCACTCYVCELKLRGGPQGSRCSECELAWMHVQ